MITANTSRQNQIASLFLSGALKKLSENDLACLLGYVQGMIANADLNDEVKIDELMKESLVSEGR